MRHLRRSGLSLGIRASWRMGVCSAAVALLAVSAAIYAQEAVPSPASQPTIATTQPEKQASTQPAGDESGAITMQQDTFDWHTRDMDLRAALTLLSKQGRKNVIATKEVNGKVSADLYGVTFKEALDAVLRSSGFIYEEKGNFIYVYTAEQYEKMKAADRKMAIQTFRLTYVTANDAKVLVTPALSKDGIVALTSPAAIGIAPSKTDTGGNNLATEDVLVVRDYEENVRKIREIIAEIDIKPEQVLIEATILQASLTEDNALGIDFNVLAGISFGGVGSVSGVPAGTTGENVIKGPLAGSALNQAIPFSATRTDFAANVPTGGLSFGLVTNNIAMFIRALESVTPTTVLANPKLLVVNKQRGEVLVGRHDGYLTTTVTETVATQTVQFLDTGTRLIVRPFIGKNGYVRMEIHPEDSTGTVKLVGTTALPESTTTELTSNVMVRDGRTIVIGGLFREETTAGRSQVPVAGNIPVVGALFRSTNDHTKRDEVIILITPHIIKQGPDEIAGEQAKNDIERHRVGARNGLQWWGRNRLANLYMRAVRHEMSEGEVDKAEWNLALALSLDPQNPEAIQAKERLSGNAYWSDERRVSNVRYTIDQMIMTELGLPWEDVAVPFRPLNANKLDVRVRDAFGIGIPAQRPIPALDALQNRKPKSSEPVDPNSAAKEAAPSIDAPKAPAPEGTRPDDVTPAATTPQSAKPNSDAPKDAAPAEATRDMAPATQPAENQ